MTDILPPEKTDFVERAITVSADRWMNHLPRDLRYSHESKLYLPSEIYCEIRERTPIGIQLIRIVYPVGKTSMARFAQVAPVENWKNMSLYDTLVEVVASCKDRELDLLNPFKISVRKGIEDLMSVLKREDIESFRNDCFFGNLLQATYACVLDQGLKS